jgi:hypothetical protein
MTAPGVPLLCRLLQWLLSCGAAVAYAVAAAAALLSPFSEVPTTSVWFVRVVVCLDWLWCIPSSGLYLAPDTNWVRDGCVKAAWRAPKSLYTRKWEQTCPMMV